MARSTGTSYVFFFFFLFRFDTMLFIFYFIKVSGSNPPGANYLCLGQVHTEPCSGFNWASASGQWD